MRSVSVCLIFYCSHLGVEMDVTEVVMVRISDFLFNRRASLSQVVFVVSIDQVTSHGAAGRGAQGPFPPSANTSQVICGSVAPCCRWRLG